MDEVAFKSKIGFWKSLLIILAVNLAIFLGLEFSLRMIAHFGFGMPVMDLRIFVHDDELAWKPNPNYDGPGLGCRKIKFNRFGFRGEDYSRKGKEKNSIRIMLAGDSNTAAWGLEDYERTYPQVMQRALSEKLGNRFRVEAVNSGVVAYSTFQGKKLIARHFKDFAPDIVTVMYGANDIIIAAQADKVKIPPQFGSVTLISTLEQTMTYRVMRISIRKALAPVFRLIHHRRIEPPKAESQGSLRVVPEDYKQNLLEIARFTSARGAKLVLITYPYASRDPYYRQIMEGYAKSVWECQKESGCAVLDFQSITKEHPIDSVFMNFPRDPVHLTYYGHKLLGEKLSECIYKLITAN